MSVKKRKTNGQARTNFVSSIRGKSLVLLYSASPMQKVIDLVVHMGSGFVRLRLRMHNGTNPKSGEHIIGVIVQLFPHIFRLLMPALSQVPTKNTATVS
jgi:hypothetical protein